MKLNRSKFIQKTSGSLDAAFSIIDKLLEVVEREANINKDDILEIYNREGVSEFLVGD